jgi:hypothetical protein
VETLVYKESILNFYSIENSEELLQLFEEIENNLSIL